MGKDKKKKKKQGEQPDETMKEYNDSLELLKAKHEQLDGLLREAQLYLNEAKAMRDEAASRLDLMKREASFDN